jgi:hypothetical protein
MESCGNCRFYEHRNIDIGGDCRRSPPIIVDALIAPVQTGEASAVEAEPLIMWASRFPIVDVADWCGEWRVGPSET